MKKRLGFSLAAKCEVFFTKIKYFEKRYSVHGYRCRKKDSVSLVILLFRRQNFALQKCAYFKYQ